MSRFRRPAAAMALSVGLVGVGVAASACSLTSPKVIATPYAASDGTNADLEIPGGGTVKFRNFLLISDAKGAPGVLLGAVATDHAEPVQLVLYVLDQGGQEALGQGQLTVTPGELVRFGPGGTQNLQVPDVKVQPGSVLTLSVQSASGTRSFTLPVLRPEAAYAGVTPSAVPTPTESPSESPSPSGSPSESAGPSASPTSSARATVRATATPSKRATASPTAG